MVKNNLFSKIKRKLKDITTKSSKKDSSEENSSFFNNKNKVYGFSKKNNYKQKSYKQNKYTNNHNKNNSYNKNKTYNVNKNTKSFYNSKNKRNINLEDFKRPQDIPITRASITHVYFDVHEGKKKKLLTQKDGVYYLGKAVFKNNLRKKISIKQFNDIITDSQVKKYIKIIRDLQNIKKKFNNKFYKNKYLNKHFPNISFIKMPTQRSPNGEWVAISTSYKLSRYKIDSKIIEEFKKNKDKVMYLLVNLIENNFYPDYDLIVQFLDLKSNEVLDLNHVVFNNKDKKKIIIKNIKDFAKKLNSINKGISEYNLYLYELTKLAINYAEDKELINTLITFKNNVRFDKI